MIPVGLLARLLAFVRSPAGRRILLILAAVALLVILLITMRHHWVGLGVAQERAAEAQRLAAAVKKVAKREVVASSITDKAKTGLATEQVRIQTVTRTLIKEVPVYVTPAADDRCVVPLGFVRLHDAAASGGASGLPRAAGGPLDAPSGVQLSAVSATVVSNYGVAHDWRAEALTWRSWYAEQKAAWDKP